MQRLIFAGLIATAAGFSHGVALPRSKLVRSPALVMEEKAAAPPAKAAEGEEAEEPAPPPPPPPPEYAESLPFLVKRKQLKGYVGDVGFDPVGFSEILPMVSRRVGWGGRGLHLWGGWGGGLHLGGGGGGGLEDRVQERPRAPWA